MTIILTGWYETDEGFTMVDETGSNLNEVVSRLQKQDDVTLGIPIWNLSYIFLMVQ